MNGFNAFLPFKSFGTDPYLKDIDMFSKFRYLSEGISYFANAEAISFYVTNIKQLKSDVLKARWKIGIMKKIIRINLPYYKIYKWISKH